MEEVDAVVDNGELHCPRCGGANLHQDRVEVFTRPKEDAPVFSVVVNNGEVHHGDPSRNPSMRRQGLLISFWCETCESGLPDQELQIYQHKGTTYIKWLQPDKH